MTKSFGQRTRSDHGLVDTAMIARRGRREAGMGEREREKLRWERGEEGSWVGRKRRMEGFKMEDRG